MIQVGSFKLRGKRIFRMSPLHNHFELIGWAEEKVTIRFWLIGAVAGIAAAILAYATPTMTRAVHRRGRTPCKPPSHERRRKWRGTWLEHDGMLWSPLLGSLGLVAGFTTRAQGSMAGSRHPLEEQAAIARRSRGRSASPASRA